MERNAVLLEQCRELSSSKPPISVHRKLGGIYVPVKETELASFKRELQKQYVESERKLTVSSSQTKDTV